MEKLEIVRSIFAIARDLLLIIFLITLVAAGFTVINFVNSIDPSQLSCENLVNSAMTGNIDQIISGSGGGETGQHYTPSEEMLSLMSEAEAAAVKGDETTAAEKLDKLRLLCESKGYTEAVQKIDELKLAIQQQNYVKALSTATQLKKMFGQ